MTKFLIKTYPNITFTFHSIPLTLKINNKFVQELTNKPSNCLIILVETTPHIFNSHLNLSNSTLTEILKNYIENPQMKTPYESLLSAILTPKHKSIIQSIILNYFSIQETTKPIYIIPYIISTPNHPNNLAPYE